MSKLLIATEGCCKGHPCDNCKTCQSGRCCRRDNPGYKLPELGDWTQAIYGSIGALDDDGFTVECHICGERFRNLSMHVIQRHDVTSAEYRAYFGLGYSRALYSTQLRERIRDIAIPHLERARALIPKDSSLTPEQKSERLKGRKERPEVTQKKRKYTAPDGSDRREVLNRRARERRAADLEGAHKYRKEWYEKNRDHYLAYLKEWRARKRAPTGATQ